MLNSTVIKHLQHVPDAVTSRTHAVSVPDVSVAKDAVEDNR